MRTRLLVAAVCILILPLWFSASRDETITGSAPFATVAYAGHTTTGAFCGCGTPGCLADPGEAPCEQSARPVSDQTEKPSRQGASPMRARSSFDLGATALMLMLALFVWARVRA